MKHNKWNFKGYPPWNFMYKRVVMHLATLCHQWETKPEKIPAATVFAFVSFCQGALTLSVSSILVVAGTFCCSEAKRKNKQKTECALEASCRASISQAYKKFGTQLNKHSVMLTLNRLHQFVAVMFRSMSIYIYIYIYVLFFSSSSKICSAFFLQKRHSSSAVTACFTFFIFFLGASYVLRPGIFIGWIMLHLFFMFRLAALESKTRYIGIVICWTVVCCLFVGVQIGGLGIHDQLSFVQQFFVHTNHIQSIWHIQSFFLHQ